MANPYYKLDESFRTNVFRQIKDINKFDFNNLDTAPKPAASSTAPETKPAPKSAPKSAPKPAPKPAASGTAPKPAVPEAKPGFWTRMKSRWTPGIGQLPPAENAGIKQAGRLKSILNGINPFYGFTEAAVRQGMYDKAIADAKKAGYRNVAEIPEEVKIKF